GRHRCRAQELQLSEGSGHLGLQDMDVGHGTWALFHVPFSMSHFLCPMSYVLSPPIEASASAMMVPSAISWITVAGHCESYRFAASMRVSVSRLPCPHTTIAPAFAAAMVAIPT